jgi:uncharacterized membrane protein (DUF2068 family)
MIEILAIAIMTVTNILVAYLMIRAITAFEMQKCLYAEEYVWMLSHDVYLKQRYGGITYPIFKRHKTLPSVYTLTLQFWVNLDEYRASVRPVQEFYDG